MSQTLSAGVNVLTGGAKFGALLTWLKVAVP